MSTQLFEWIKAQEQAGKVDSSGVFTIDKSQAWEKLGASALPLEHAWILKVVQAAVVSGAALTVTQDRAQTLIRWSASPSWNHERLETAILDPEPDSDPALEHMAVAVRALAKATKLPFGLSYRDGTTAYWTGQGFQLESQASLEDAEFRLAVSHFQVGESSSFFSLDNLEAVNRSSAIATTLKNGAHCAPIKITIDGHTVSNIFQDPVFGVSQLRHPLYLLQANADPAIPSVRLRARFFPPDLTFINAPEVSAANSQLQEAAGKAQQPCLATILISGFLLRKGSGKHISYHPLPSPSQLVWVSDGVEVAREDLNLGATPTAMLVVCSAEGLPTDISGWTPRQTAERDQRKAAVMRAVHDVLSVTSTDAEVEKSPIVHIALMVVGGILTLANPPIGLIMIGGGGLGRLSDVSEAATFEGAMDKGLADLRDAVCRLWGSGG